MEAQTCMPAPGLATHDPGAQAEPPRGLLWDTLLEFPLAQAFNFSAPEAPPLAAGRAGGIIRRSCTSTGPATKAGAVVAKARSCSAEFCPCCGLPIGDHGYEGTPGGPLLHGECKAQLLLQQARVEEERSRERDMELKARHRADFDIGWRKEHIPENLSAARKLGYESLPHGSFCVALPQGSHSPSLAPTTDAAAAVNLQYLSIALNVRKQEGRDPLFSLDPRREPTSPADDRATYWQVKRFEPAWLEGTKVGEVLFQADYHLKELSMGEHAQPVVGMKSCPDLSDGDRSAEDWFAREWFVVRRADLYQAEDGTLVPCVEMGVEAREMVRGPGGLEDAQITDPGHPLVRYAAEFTRYFDLIAERRSVVHHLRELAKSVVLAKFLLESGVDLDERWFNLAEKAKAGGCLAVPQLWNERSHTQVSLRDGEILNSENLTGTSIHGVYGGVQLSLEQWGLSKKTLQPLTAPQWYPKGVDLNLDAFNLSTPMGLMRQKPRVEEEGNGGVASALGGVHEQRFLGALFNPHLSDRRCEDDKIAGPSGSPAHMQRLWSLMQEEEKVQEHRRKHFFSNEFATDHPGPLFPSSWTSVSSFGVLQVPTDGIHTKPSQGASLHAHPELKAEALFYLWQAVAPVFDRCTEDGTRFRIYRAGCLEFRTIQEHCGTEQVGAVFSSRTAHPEPLVGEESWEGWDLKEVAKAVLYVESSQSGPVEPRASFYLVLETPSGDTVIAEETAECGAEWTANPGGLEARGATAKVMRSVDCRGKDLKVGGIRRRVASLPASQGGFIPRAYECVLQGTGDSTGSHRAPGAAPQETAMSRGYLADDFSDLNYVI